MFKLLQRMTKSLAVLRRRCPRACRTRRNARACVLKEEVQQSNVGVGVNAWCYYLLRSKVNTMKSVQCFVTYGIMIINVYVFASSSSDICRVISEILIYFYYSFNSFGLRTFDIIIAQLYTRICLFRDHSTQASLQMTLSPLLKTLRIMEPLDATVPILDII